MVSPGFSRALAEARALGRDVWCGLAAGAALLTVVPWHSCQWAAPKADAAACDKTDMRGMTGETASQHLLTPT